mmetsp:Transcript_49536/g.105980  ORF Transcript_49536/g.105980 Transcript_49536/m.105980 type:complete len:334 (+) Transcript_49536:1381-2382(+)
MPARVLVVVSVDACLPIMLHTDWAPEGLEPVHEEFVGQRRRPLLLLVTRQERRPDLLATVCEGAGVTAAAASHVRVGSTKAVLVDLWVVEGASRAVAAGDQPKVRTGVYGPRTLWSRGATPEDAPVGVALEGVHTELSIAVREAADLLATAVTVVAELSLVLGRVVGDLLARVGEGAEIAARALLTLGDVLAKDVPVPKLARERVDEGPAPLRLEVVAEALGWRPPRPLVPWAVAMRELGAHHGVVVEDVLPVVCQLLRLLPHGQRLDHHACGVLARQALQAFKVLEALGLLRVWRQHHHCARSEAFGPPVLLAGPLIEVWSPCRRALFVPVA